MGFSAFALIFASLTFWFSHSVEAQSTRQWSETCDQLARHAEVLDRIPSLPFEDESLGSHEIRAYRDLVVDACDLAYLMSQTGGVDVVLTGLFRSDVSPAQMLSDMKVFVDALDAQQGDFARSIQEGYWQQTEQMPISETGFVLIGQSSGRLSYTRLLGFLEAWGE